MKITSFESALFTEKNTFTKGIEGPACDRDGNVYAVNYTRDHTIGKISPDGTCHLFVELPEGSNGCGIRFNRAGDMFVADYTGHKVLRIDRTSQQIIVHAHEPLMNQPNDLAITEDGVLFASDPNWKEGTGQLWRIDLDGSAERLETGMGTTNGIEVNPDGTKLYVNETVQRRIWEYDLSHTHSVSNKRLLIEFPDYGLDGMRCDREGNLYVTRFGKGTIAKISPAGEMLLEVQLSGKKCTNLTFGGPDGKTCYVTLADTGNIERFRVDQPGRCWELWQ